MDPVTVMTSVITVAGFAFNACVVLHDTIRGLRSQNKAARALKAELGDLITVLQSLVETISANSAIDFNSLRVPLQRCGSSCQEYGKIIERCTKHSDGTSRSSIRDWVTQRYLQGDINDFRDMIATHKSTINIALAHANLRIIAITPDVLENYKDMIFDTTNDLKRHLADVQAKIDRLRGGDETAVGDVAVEWQAMLEEKQSAQLGLDMCAQLSCQIQRFEDELPEAEAFRDRPSARKHVQLSFGNVRGSINTLVNRLRAHEDVINTQVEALSLDGAISESVSAQLERLQLSKESIRHCIRLVSEAEEAAEERSNVFEDITMADHSYSLAVSNVNDLVTARRVKLSGRARHIGGQMTDETIQRSIEALTKLDEAYDKIHGRRSDGDGEGKNASDEKLLEEERSVNKERPTRFTRFGSGRQVG